MKEKIQYIGRKLSGPGVFKSFLKLFRNPVSVFKQAKIIFLDADLKKKSAKEQFDSYKKALSVLLHLSGTDNSLSNEIPILEYALSVSETDEDAVKLGNLFKDLGSDKSTDNNYYLLYAGLLKGIHEPFNIFEMGLGTNHLEMISNMGPDGKPGASLRAFKAMYPTAQVFGADIDKRILFSEERIQTFYADQLNTDSLDHLQKELSGTQFKLVIDDGLHTPEANINTFHFAMNILAPDGIFVVEDIKPEDVGFFHITKALLKDRYTFDIVQTRNAYICVVRKKG